MPGAPRPPKRQRGVGGRDGGRWAGGQASVMRRSLLTNFVERFRVLAEPEMVMQVRYKVLGSVQRTNKIRTRLQ